MNLETNPIVYIIAGPNGAGKTTFATSFLPDFVDCREFLNADLIAAGLSPFAPGTQNVRAGRLLLDRIRELTVEKRNFSFETTLSGRTYVKLLNGVKAQGYRVVLFFLCLPSVEMAISRVASRVRQGGHDIPEVDIRRRFDAGLRNLLHLYRPLADSLWVYDASFLPPSIIASEVDGQLTVMQKQKFDRLQKDAKA
ncbi:MAG: Zeta toxin family protein [Planctomycetota bacterium]|nr:Zeta toxin family protein [Planctomycetota bacterium]MDA1212145.1 Zeta toxin family protein [Planctomycetota bacterium]